jgi:transcription elongation factor SPT4
MAQKVTKKNSDKYKYVDSEDEEVSGPSSGDDSQHCRNLHTPMSTSPPPLHSPQEHQKRRGRKLSTDMPTPPSPNPPKPHRQDHLKDGTEQSHPPQQNADLARALFGETDDVLHSNANHPIEHGTTSQETIASFPGTGYPPTNLVPTTYDQAFETAVLPDPRILPSPRPESQTSASQSRPKPASHRPKRASVQPEAEPDMSGGAYIPPNQQRHMRACMVCSVVRTELQFKQQGCPNCESFLELAGNKDAVDDCTSQVFDGLVTVSDTSKSWVARWQRLEGYVPGVYAVQVEGILGEDYVAAAESAGVHYIPRDGSVNESLPNEG